MTNETHGFEVFTLRNRDTGEGILNIRLELENGLSQQALRHIELEAKDAIADVLSPLGKTIKGIIEKDKKKRASKICNPDDDICEACQ